MDNELYPLKQEYTECVTEMYFAKQCSKCEAAYRKLVTKRMLIQYIKKNYRWCLLYFSDNNALY